MFYARPVFAGGEKWIKESSTPKDTAWLSVHLATPVDLFKIQNVNVVLSAGGLDTS